MATSSINLSQSLYNALKTTYVNSCNQAKVSSTPVKIGGTMKKPSTVCENSSGLKA